jgi:hypothetical protein
MAQVETIQVQDPDNEKDFLVMNVADFEAHNATKGSKKLKVWEPAAEKATEPKTGGETGGAGQA